MPRTGSTSIYKTLKLFGASVIPYGVAKPSCYEKDINGFHDPNIWEPINKYYKFTSIRNPYRRMLSHFLFAQDNKKHRLYDISDNFEAFVNICITNNYLIPQTQFIHGLEIDGFICIEGCYQQQIQNLPPFHHLCVPAVEKTNDVTYIHPWQNFYNKKIEKQVLDWAINDFITFGYSTDISLTSNLPICLNNDG